MADDAGVNPDPINVAFDGIAWIDRDEAEGGEDENTPVAPARRRAETIAQLTHQPRTRNNY